MSLNFIVPGSSEDCPPPARFYRLGGKLARVIGDVCPMFVY
jgi:hypothetical protein